VSAAQTMRRAAALMREQHGPEHVRHTMWSVLADWLDEEASCVEQADSEFERRNEHPSTADIRSTFRASYEAASEYQHRSALAVARAYLEGA